MKMRGALTVLLLPVVALALLRLCSAEEKTKDSSQKQAKASAEEKPGGGSEKQAEAPAKETAKGGSRKHAVVAEKPTRPPRHLKRLPDGHWTPWEAPAAPEGANVHTVVAGDTLWDLSAHNLSNPYLWPQIWDQNRYILDSHWI